MEVTGLKVVLAVHSFSSHLLPSQLPLPRPHRAQRISMGPWDEWEPPKPCFCGKHRAKLSQRPTPDPRTEPGGPSVDVPSLTPPQRLP